MGVCIIIDCCRIFSGGETLKENSCIEILSGGQICMI